MRALVVVAWGLLLVVFDFRFGGVDLIPDPIGWAMAAVSLRGLGRHHGGFAVASTLALVGALVSIPDWFGPDALGDAQPVVETVLIAVQTAFVFATCTAIMAVAPPRRRAADLIRWWDLGLTAATLFLGLAVAGTSEVEFGATVPADQVSGPVVAMVVVAALATLAVLVCFLVLLVRTAREPEPDPRPVGAG